MAKGAKKEKKIKTLFDDDNYKNALDFCASSGLEYEIIRSNYTLEIRSSFFNISFIQKQHSEKAFIAKAKILKDIKGTGYKTPEIDKEDLVYFNFAMPERLKKGKHTIYNIDIKSAYANVLKRHGLISGKTFYFMSKLSKANRLMCVGALAAKKKIFLMKGDETVSCRTEILESENWFYFCVLKVNEIMNIARNEIQADFLLYWVDGIFFDNQENAKKIGLILEKMGYNYSYDICTEFEYIENEKEKKISYIKGEKRIVAESGKVLNRKILSLPKKNDQVDEFLIKLLNNYTNELK